MLIGIIGTGHIGSTLAHLFVKAGHEVVLANSRGPESLGDLVGELDGHAKAATAEDAARSADLVVVSVPFKAYPALPAEALSGRIVIDTNNYYPQRDGHVGSLDDDSTTSSELLQRHLSGSRVVKAFNAMQFDHLRDHGREGGAADRYGIPVAADDQDAKRQVFDLIEQIGYEPVDAGRLADSRTFQPGTDVYTADLWAGDLRRRIGVPPV